MGCVLGTFQSLSQPALAQSLGKQVFYFLFQMRKLRHGAGNNLSKAPPFTMGKSVGRGGWLRKGGWGSTRTLGPCAQTLMGIGGESGPHSAAGGHVQERHWTPHGPMWDLPGRWAALQPHSCWPGPQSSGEGSLGLAGAGPQVDRAWYLSSQRRLTLSGAPC